jgi:hypothetical protein
MCIRWKVFGLNFNILNGRAVCFAMHMSERRVVITHRQQEVKLAIVSMLCNSLLRACTSILSLFSNYTNSSAILQLTIYVSFSLTPTLAEIQGRF